MLKKYVFISVSFITLFFFCFDNLKAYDFKDSNNDSVVNDLIVEIFDAKEQYEDLAGKYEEKIVKIYNSNNSSYWWPIGSEATVEYNGKKYAKDEPYPTSVTSNFGYRKDPLGRGRRFHSGTDIAGAAGNGIVNIIAAKDGIVVYPTSNSVTNCPSSNSLSSCGGGYGNYVIIQHSDGNYTLYGHLYENSLTGHIFQA